MAKEKLWWYEVKITEQDIKRIIKEELQRFLDEDLSLLKDMTPGDALAYIERELNGKTWFFWDLESIGFAGQVTQYGAIAFRDARLTTGKRPTETDRFEANVELNENTLEKYVSEQDILNRAEQIFDDYEASGVVTRELNFILKTQEPNFLTVSDVLEYTNYKRTENDLDEKVALQQFLDWVKGLGDNVVSIGHNIKSFDRNKIIKEGERLGIDTSHFQTIDIFDTVNFQRQLLKHIAIYQSQQGDQKMSKFFDQKERAIKGEIDKIEKVEVFNAKLQRLMDVYGPGPDYVQLHTAVDDTEQLITAFFNLYADVKELVETNEKVKNLTTGINVSRAQKELGTKDIKDPLEISQALKQTKRGY